MLNDYELHSKGWQCPVCKNVMSPMMTYCPFCNRDNNSYQSSTGECTHPTVKNICDNTAKTGKTCDLAHNDTGSRRILG